MDSERKKNNAEDLNADQFRLPGYMTANPLTYGLIKNRQQELKRTPTMAEKLLWEYLRNNKIGHKIRRQHVVDIFIADFICLKKKLIIEIDGKIHLRQIENDEVRTTRLKVKGYDVIRFTNEEVISNPEQTAEKIRLVLDGR